MDNIICKICNKETEGFGYNALPVKSGRCCKMCYDTIVKSKISDIQKNKEYKFFGVET